MSTKDPEQTYSDAVDALVPAEERMPVAHQASPLAALLSDPAKLNALNVDTLERMLALQERMDEKAERAAFTEAMARFQASCPPIPKRKEVKDRNGKLLYKHAELWDIVETIRATEEECGFTHSWDTVITESGLVEVTCTVEHCGGHRRSSMVPIPPTKGVNTNASQDRGIQITYGRRYSLENAFGIASGSPDTDGVPPHEPPAAITPQQAADLDALLDEAGADRARFLRWLGVESVEAVPASRYDEAVARVRAKMERGE